MLGFRPRGQPRRQLAILSAEALALFAEVERLSRRSEKFKDRSHELLGVHLFTN